MIADGIWNRAEDLMRLKIAQIDPRYAIVGVVIYKEPAAIVFRVGLRQRRVMHIAPGEIAEHFLRFLIESITGARVRRENWNRNDVTQRRNARDEHLSGMSARIEEIIFILLARRDVTGERVRGAITL